MCKFLLEINHNNDILYSYEEVLLVITKLSDYINKNSVTQGHSLLQIPGFHPASLGIFSVFKTFFNV